MSHSDSKYQDIITQLSFTSYLYYLLMLYVKYLARYPYFEFALTVRWLFCKERKLEDPSENTGMWITGF